MNTRTKRFERMRSHPSDGWTIEDVQAVCAEFGFYCIPPRSGSHYKVAPPSKTEALPIPAHRPIKPVYIRKLVALIERHRKES